MLSHFKKSFFSRVYKKTVVPRAEYKLKRFEKRLANYRSILDVGSGHGALCHLLSQHGFNIQAVDIEDASLFAECVPKIIENEELPYSDNEFDCVLLITVLHHVNDFKKLLMESARVGKHVLIMEDTFNSNLQKRLTFYTDSLVNWHWKTHPHNNLTHHQWLGLFSNKGYEVLWQTSFKTAIFFNQSCFLLKTE